MSQSIRMTARVFREEGMYIAECVELGWSTHGGTLEDVLADVPRMVRDYFAGYQRLGRLAQQLVHLGITGPVPAALGVDVDLDLRDVVHALRAEQHIDVPLAA